MVKNEFTECEIKVLLFEGQDVIKTSGFDGEVDEFLTDDDA